MTVIATEIHLVQVMNNKVAIFTDLHIGVHQNSSFWHDVTIEWAKWFKQEVDKRGIKEIVFCGDYFHYRDEISLLSLDIGNKVLDILNDYKIYMITGNHDCYYKETSEINSLSILKGRQNVEVCDVLSSHSTGNRKVTFCPWGTKVSDIDKSDIIFGHFELQNFQMNAFKVCEHGDDAETLATKAPLIISGHFHLRDEKKINNSTILYAGNPFEMDFGDSYQKKGIYFLDIDSLKYEFVENTFSPKHIKLTLSELITNTDFETYCKLTLPNNIIKLIIDKNISTEHLDALVAKMTAYKPTELRVDYDVNYNKIKLENTAELDLSGVVVEKAIEEFINLLDITNKSEVIEYTTALYLRSKL